MQDLYEIRNRLAKIASEWDAKNEAEFEKMNKSKFYHGPALAYQQDPNHRKKQFKKKAIANDLSTWRGAEDIESICQMFMDFLTTPTSATHARLIEEAEEAEQKKLQRIREAEEAKKKKDEKNSSNVEQRPSE